MPASSPRRSAGRSAIATRRLPSEKLRAAGLPEHVVHHLTVMTELHKQGRYDRISEDYLKLTGEAPTSMADFVKLHAAEFTRSEATV